MVWLIALLTVDSISRRKSSKFMDPNPRELSIVRAESLDSSDSVIRGKSRGRSSVLMEEGLEGRVL